MTTLKFTIQMVINASSSSSSASFSANKMQKQVEVKMDGSHLEPVVETPESMCSSLCDKIMKNMVLTLTILGELFHYCQLHSRPVRLSLPLVRTGAFPSIH